MKRFRFRFGAMPWGNVQEPGSSRARWLRRNQTASLQGVLGRYCVKGISAEKNMLPLWNFKAKWESSRIFIFFIKCHWTKPRKQDFGQDAIQRTRRTFRQPISEDRSQMLM